MLEAWFTHLPGVTVVCPSSAEDEAGLLVSPRIRSDDPVLFFDAKDLWGVEGEVANAGAIEPIPFGKARTVREGGDITVVTWSAMVPHAAEAADTLAGDGVAVDLIDLRTLWPWDVDAVCTSVEKTGRLLVTHEATEVGGFGGEVVATVIDRLGPQALKAVGRLGAPRVPIPFSPPLETAMRVTPADIVAKAKAMVPSG
jgi:pyruvate/2-oxoglutarate/acetoin dehydrogenase E1 component